MNRPDAPRSCEECRERQVNCEDPELCWFDGQCPFDEIDGHDDLLVIYRFAMQGIEMWETGGENGGPKTKHFGINTERFRLALDLFQVPIRQTDPASTLLPFENALEAHDWVTLVANAATKAPLTGLEEARDAMRRRNRESQVG